LLLKIAVKNNVGYVDYMLKYNLTINIMDSHCKIEMKFIGNKVYDKNEFTNYLFDGENKVALKERNIL